MNTCWYKRCANMLFRCRTGNTLAIFAIPGNNILKKIYDTRTHILISLQDLNYWISSLLIRWGFSKYLTRLQATTRDPLTLPPAKFHPSHIPCFEYEQMEPPARVSPSNIYRKIFHLYRYGGFSERGVSRAPYRVERKHLIKIYS